MATLTGPITAFRLSALSEALAEQGMAVLHQAEADGRFDIADGATQGWARMSLLGRTAVEALEQELAQQFATAAEQATTGEASFDISSLDGERCFTAVMRRDASGFLTTVSDVTEQRAATKALDSLLREVSHRSKNLLAIVQSVAMQTAVHSGGVQDFLDKFRGRLHALSGTQDLVTESNWRGTHLRALVSAQLTRVGAPALTRLSVTGVDPILGPNASLHIGLAIHELAANAVRHGAFAPRRGGRVEFNAELAPNASGGSDLVIDWHETGTGQLEATVARFGTLVLERIVPLSVGGSSEYHIEPDTIRYRLRVPADQFDA